MKRISRYKVLLLLAAMSAPGAHAAGESTAAAARDPSRITELLDQTISWYRLLPVEQQLAADTGDLPVVTDNRRTAEQIVRLAFEYARAEAAALAKEPGADVKDDAAQEYRALTQLDSRLDQQIRATQTELDAAKQKLSGAAASERRLLESQISELQSELGLANARRDAVRSMLEFVSGSSANGLGATGLRAQIEMLAGAVSLPTVPSAANPTGAANNDSSLATRVAIVDKSGSASLWDLSAQAIGLSRKIDKIGTLIGLTTALAQTARDTAAPLVSELKQLTRQGDVLAEGADTATSSELVQAREQLDALAARFKQASAAVIPLTKQAMLLSLYQRNLARWRDASQGQYKSVLRKLGIRAAVLAGVLALVIAAAELWKRAVYRYVHEPRRRYQFLLLRRFIVWFVIVLIVAFALASRLDSFVTFAGLLTAGVAVALQNVILSVVGYFFLIGRYGIRVGDRVQIGEVSGEVIDVGLVRLHLMEWGDDGPTGRVVAFSNSIVFQASGGLFKQIPGIHFAWHEIGLTLLADTPLAALKERLLQAVQTVLNDYRDEIERQNKEIARTAISSIAHPLRAKIRLRFIAAGIEATIQYPVDLQHAAEIDERISQELLNTLEREPRLKLAGAAR